MNGMTFRLGNVATDERDLLQQPIAIHHQPATRDVSGHAVRPSRKLTEEPAECRCPHCNSIIYSRRHKLCGLCGRELPEEFRFSTVEAQRLENILRLEQERHRTWMKRSLAGASSI